MDRHLSNSPKRGRLPARDGRERGDEEAREGRARRGGVHLCCRSCHCIAIGAWLNRSASWLNRVVQNGKSCTLRYHWILTISKFRRCAVDCSVEDTRKSVSVARPIRPELLARELPEHEQRKRFGLQPERSDRCEARSCYRAVPDGVHVPPGGLGFGSAVLAVVSAVFTDILDSAANLSDAGALGHGLFRVLTSV